MKTNDTSNDLYSLVERTLIPHTSFQAAQSAIEQTFIAMHHCVDPICLAIVGESRTGKSRTLEHFERSHEPFRTESGRRVPFLRVKVPSKPTVKGLGSLLLYSLGDPAFDKGTEVAQTLRLLTLMEQTETKLLALDEFQHFHDKATQKVQHHVADWLKVLVDEAKIGLVVTGLPRSMAVIEQNEQLTGRFMAPIQLPRFDWRDQNQREEFVGILDALEQALKHFEFPKMDTDEIAFRFYCASGGLIGYLIKILREAVWKALANLRRSINLAELESAFNSAVVKHTTVPPEFNPFGKLFRSDPTEKTIDLAMSIGKPAPEPVRTRKSKIDSTSENLSSILSTKN